MRDGRGDLEKPPAGEAIPALVEELGPRMYAIGLKFCGNPADAEDLVQETFLQAYRKWHQFEGRSSPASWLYAIAARGCQRMQRRRSGEPAQLASLDEELPSGLALVAQLPAADGDPEAEELRREAAEVVDRALARLPADFRIALVLKEIAELSLREIAAILGVKPATVKTRVHRGRLALRAALVADLGEEVHGGREHTHQVCRDLLHAKMDAMDQGVEFPVRDEDLCDRCRSFVRSLDLAAEACRWVRGGELPEALRRRLESALGTSPVGTGA